MKNIVSLSLLLISISASNITYSAQSLSSISEQPIIKEWTNSPVLLLQKNGSRSEREILLKNISAEYLQAFPASINIEKDKFRVYTYTNSMKASVESQGAKKGGYHWLTARQENKHAIRVANTVVYFSNPSPSPRKIVSHIKAELEVRPINLPREHGHFRANEDHMFKVLFNGKPLSDFKVLFQSKNGSKKIYQTDENGLFNLTFPDDFESQQDNNDQHNHGRKQSDFVLTTELNNSGKYYLSSFNYHYQPDAFFNKNLAMGAGFSLFGMLLAAPLLRHRKEKKA